MDQKEVKSNEENSNLKIKEPKLMSEKSDNESKKPGILLNEYMVIDRYAKKEYKHKRHRHRSSSSRNDSRSKRYKKHRHHKHDRKHRRKSYSSGIYHILIFMVFSTKSLN